VQAGDDLRTEGIDLFVVVTGMIRVYEEVQSQPVAVDVTEHMHQPGLDPSPIHAADDMKDTNRLAILFRGIHQADLALSA
jgi:hypothetical protein